MIKQRQTSSFCGIEAEPSTIFALINRALEAFWRELSETCSNAENNIVWVIEIKITEVRK